MKNSSTINIILLAAGLYLIAQSLLPDSSIFTWHRTELLLRSVFFTAGAALCALPALFFLWRKKYNAIAPGLFTKKAGMTLAAVIIMLIMLELGLRGLELVFPTSYYAPHPVYDHTLVPNIVAREKTDEFDTLIKANSLGMRNREIGSKEKQRILVLGDSHTMGLGVENNETYSYLLEQKLSGYEVINAAVSSYSTILYYLFLKENIQKLRPDLIIVAEDGTDINGDYVLNKIAQFDNKGEPAAVNGYGNNFVSWIFTESRLLKKARQAIGEAVFRATLNTTTCIRPEEIGDINFDLFAIMRNETPFNQTYEAAWNLTKNHFLRIKRIADENSVPVIIVIYPHPYHVAGEWPEGRTCWLMERGKVYPDQYARVVEEFMQRNNIIVFNVFDDFKNETSMKPLYHPYDGHLNRNGHMLMANILYSRLAGMV